MSVVRFLIQVPNYPQSSQQQQQQQLPLPARDQWFAPVDTLLLFVAAPAAALPLRASARLPSALRTSSPNAVSSSHLLTVSLFQRFYLLRWKVSSSPPLVFIFSFFQVWYPFFFFFLSSFLSPSSPCFLAVGFLCYPASLCRSSLLSALCCCWRENQFYTLSCLYFQFLFFSLRFVHFLKKKKEICCFFNLLQNLFGFSWVWLFSLPTPS